MRKVITFAKQLPPPLRGIAQVLYQLSSKAGFALKKPYYLACRTGRRAALGALERNKKPAILFLASEAGLTQYFTGHALLARTLNETGHQAIVLSCAGGLPHCNVKSAARAAPGHGDALCGQCRSASLALGHKYGLADISLENLVGQPEQAEIDTIIAATNGKPWTISHDGIAFGEFAQGESLRARRKLNIDEFDAADHADLLATIQSALRVYFAVRKLATRLNITRIVYYGAYGHWLPTVTYARRSGIPTTQIEHGYNRDIDVRLLNLRPAPVHEQQMRQTLRWADYRDIPLDPATARRVAESGLFRLSNHGRRSTHSPNFELRQTSILEEFGLSVEKKTLVAYSSSADELSAAKHIYRGLGLDYGNGARPFEDSNTWLVSLISWAGAQSDLQLVVRLHPRMATPAGQPLSVEEQELRNLLTVLPENVRVIWPRDKISSYNLAEVADAVLVSWSTIGLELARLGVPVIAAFSDRGSFAVGSFIGFEETAERYFAAIRSAIDRGASCALIAEAMRWTHFLFLSPTVDFSASVPSDDFTGVPDWKMPADRSRILRTLIDGKDASEQRMAELPRGNLAVARETEAVRRSIEYFIIFFMTGQDAPEGQIESVSALPAYMVALSYRGKLYRSRSPLAHRLAVLWNGGTQATPTLELGTVRA